MQNAEALGIDLRTADHLVLSHGHYDHTGGLPALEGIVPDPTPIHAHTGIFPQRFSLHADRSVHPVGVPPQARAVLAARREHLALIDAPTEIAPGVWLTGTIPRQTAYEDTGGSFWLDEACTTPDPILDDMALWIDRPEGLWIVLGCAHAGTVNTVQHICSVAGRESVYALIGGTHLRKASEARLEATAAFLAEVAPPILQPCHCSGTAIREALCARGLAVGPGGA